MLDMLIVLGMLLAFLGGIFLLVEAFKEHILWGIACLFLPPASLVFMLLHWRVAKKPALMELTGFAIVIYCLMAGGTF